MSPVLVQVRLDEKFSTDLIRGLKIIVDSAGEPLTIPSEEIHRSTRGGIEIFTEGSDCDGDGQNEYCVTIPGNHFVKGLFSFRLESATESVPFAVRCEVVGESGLLESVQTTRTASDSAIRFTKGGSTVVDCVVPCREGVTCKRPAQPPVVAPIPDREVQAGREIVVVATGQGDGLSCRAEMRAPGGAASGAIDGGASDGLWVEPVVLGAGWNATSCRLTWRPLSTQVAADPYTLRVTMTNAAGLSASVEGRIRVTSGNSTPYLDPPLGYVTVAEDQALALRLNAVDPDGDPVRIEICDQTVPGGETVEVAFQDSEWKLVWTPSFSAARADPYSVCVKLFDDKTAAPVLETAYITVRDTVRPPVCDSSGTITARAGRTKCFTVSASVPDGIAPTYSADFSAFGSRATTTFDKTTRAACITPSDTLIRTDPYGFVFTADDGRIGGRTRCVVNVTVTPDCESPAFTPVAAQTVTEEAVVSLCVHAENSDNSAITYASDYASVLGAAASRAWFNPTTGCFQWTTDETDGRAEAYCLEFTATEASQKCPAAVVSTCVTVNDVDHRQRDGFACSSNEQCRSGKCIDNVCCATTCTGTCVACNVPGKLGTCSAVPLGEPHGSDCSGGAAACLTGKCDGAGSCQRIAVAGVCSAAACTNGNLFRPAATCGDVGGCPILAAQSCPNGRTCENATACRTTCTVDADCVSGTYCMAGSCVGVRPLGNTCDRGAQCQGGNCVDGTCCSVSSCGDQATFTCATVTGTCSRKNGADCSNSVDCASGVCSEGVCCATACTGTCVSCNVTGFRGVCKAVPSGQPHGSDCAGGSAACLSGNCNGAGACERISAGGTCRAATCTGGNQFTPAATCSDVGGCPTTQQAACANSLTCASGSACRTTCSGDGDCVSGTYCSNNACVSTRANGQSCTSAAQCQSGNCVDNTCCNASSCGASYTCATTNGVCLKRLGVGASDPGECASGIRADGVCCNTACSSACWSCVVTGFAGTCKEVSAGQTHASDCSTGAADCLTGMCNGAGACARIAQGAECAAATCSNPNSLTPARTCGATGSCPTASPTTCGGNLTCLSGTTCRSTCSQNSDCRDGFRCVAPNCVALSANGTACSSGSECASGKCIDGVCCATDCNIACRACNVAGNLGTCVNVPAGQSHGSDCGIDPASTCLSGACNGSGGCSRLGVGAQCAASTCTATNTFTPARTCGASGGCPAGSPTTCGSSFTCADATTCRSSCTLDSHCTSGNFCLNPGASGTCTALRSLGASCSGNNQCSSGKCTDGVCCDVAACSTCKACNLNGQGTCSNVGAGQDPKLDCTIAGGNAICGVGWCNGLGACAFPGSETRCSDGLSCTTSDVCDGLGSCAGCTLRWLSPRPFRDTMRDTWAASSTTVFYVGDYGSIWKFNDTTDTWTRMDSGTRSNLFGVWGSSATNVFAVGAGGIILRYDGNASNQWNRMTSPVAIQLNAVSGSSSTNVYAVGNQAVVLRFDGTNWLNESPVAALAELPNLNAVWTNGTSGSSLTMVGGGAGSAGAAAWRTGTGTWTRNNLPSNCPVYALAGFSSTDVLATSPYCSGPLYRWNGSAWSSVACAGAGCSYPKSILPITSTDFWLAGDRLNHWVSGTTTEQFWPMTYDRPIRGNRLAATGVLYFAGMYDVIHDGASTFTVLTDDVGMLPDGNAYPLFHRAAAASSPSDIYTVSVRPVNNSANLRWFNGTSWTVLSPPVSTQWRGVWRGSGSEVYFVGDNGTIVRYNPPTWTTVAPVSSASLKAIHGSSATNIYAVGDNDVLHYDGFVWTRQNFAVGAGPNNIVGVHVLDATHIYLAAGNGIWQSQGDGNWSEMGLGWAMGKVWAASSTAIYSLESPLTEGDGRRGYRMYKYNGTAWSQMTNPVDYDTAFDDLWGVDSSHIFVSVSIVSGSTFTRYEVYRYDGTRWRRLGLVPLSANGSSSWRASALTTTGVGDLFMVGRDVAVWKDGTCDP